MEIQFKKVFTWSNLISFIRLLLAIPIIFLLDNIDGGSTRAILIIIFFFAYLTDILDGYVARKFNEISELGKIIDPLADKVLVAVIIIKLMLIGEISTEYFFIVILRDVIIFVGGIFVSNKIGKILPSNLLGKITVVSIGSYILCVVGNVDLYSEFICDAIYYLSIFLCFASVFGYALRAYETIKWDKKSEVF